MLKKNLNLGKNNHLFLSRINKSFFFEFIYFIEKQLIFFKSYKKKNCKKNNKCFI
jgi:hypothetical protein